MLFWPEKSSPSCNLGGKNTIKLTTFPMPKIDKFTHFNLAPAVIWGQNHRKCQNLQNTQKQQNISKNTGPKLMKIIKNTVIYHVLRVLKHQKSHTSGLNPSIYHTEITLPTLLRDQIFPYPIQNSHFLNFSQTKTLQNSYRIIKS